MRSGRRKNVLEVWSILQPKSGYDISGSTSALLPVLFALQRRVYPTVFCLCFCSLRFRAPYSKSLQFGPVQISTANGTSSLYTPSISSRTMSSSTVFSFGGASNTNSS
jgi:hypothetical protein